MLNIRINGRFLEATAQTGVQRWANEVLFELQQNSEVNIEILEPKSFFRSGIRGHIWDQFVLPFMGNRQHTLVSLANWGPYFTYNQVLVIHDLIPLENPTLFKKSYSLACRHLLPRIVHRVKMVCVPSVNTSNEVSKLLELSNDKLKVLGAGIRFNEAIALEKNPYSMDFEYFIFIGGFNERKNLKFLLDFWDYRADQNVKLLVIVRSDERVTHKTSVLNLNSSVVLIEDPVDDFLFSLYKNSIALLFPSISEGFGLPLLEVMSTGKPFISNQVGVASDLSIGDSRVLELNHKAWLSEINRLTSKPSIYDKSQVFLASQYNWKLVADKLIKALIA